MVRAAVKDGHFGRPLALKRGLVLEGRPARRHTGRQDQSSPGGIMRDNDLFQLALAG